VKNKIIAALIVASVLFITACGRTGTISHNYTKTQEREPQPVYSVSYDIIGGSDVMPLGVWWGPFRTNNNTVNGNSLPEYVSEKYFELLKDSGINIISVTPDNYSGGEKAVSSIEKALNLSKDYNIGYFMHDSNTYSIPTSQAMLERVSSYINHEAVVGIHMKDEPRANEFDGISFLYKNYDALGLESKHLFTNLLPSIASNLSGTGDPMSFEEYIDAFLTKVNARFLSYDRYPFTYYGQGSDTQFSLFQELSALRRVSEKHQVPFWCFIQAGSQWNDSRDEDYVSAENPFPSEGELIWNVNVNIAYGVKGVHYFTFIQPEHFSWAPGQSRDPYRNGMIGLTGNRNMWYYYIQKANKQIAAADYVLMNSANMGVIPVGDKAGRLVVGTERLESFRELTDVQAQNAVVGCFDFFGKTALYAVNNSTEYKQEITLNFDGNYGYDVVQRGVSAFVTGNSITLTAEAGEGILISLR